jgi:PAS domain S-box-containing protein
LPPGGCKIKRKSQNRPDGSGDATAVAEPRPRSKRKTAVSSGAASKTPRQRPRVTAGNKTAGFDRQLRIAESRNLQLQAMVRIAGTILQFTDLEDILSAITRELSNIVEFDRVSVAFVEPGEDSLVLGHIHTGEGKIDDIAHDRRIPMDETTVIGWVARHRKPILRSDIPSDRRFEEVVKEARLKSDMVVPLVVRDKLIGTLNFGSHRKNAFTNEILEDVVACSYFVCGAIEHAMLLSQAMDINERYRTLQRSASDIVMLVDRNTGKLIEVNRKCCETLGYDEDELKAKSYFDLFPHEEQLQARRDFINILSQKSKTFVDRRLIRRDGEILFVDVSATLITIKDDSIIQVVVHDISQRKMLEQQIIMQNMNLQEANRKLREVDQMKSEFLANISHELRTPLSIIIAYSESLRDESITAEHRMRFLDVIAENGQNLLTLIDDLLDLSQLEASGTTINRSLSHVHDVINSVWPRVEPLAAEKKIRLTFDPGHKIPVVNIDNRRILQVLMSLIHNAIKFTAEGGTVDVRTRCDDRGVVVEVQDNGSGIAPSEIQQVFDTFRQLDGSSTRQWGGLGIGLAMAKHIVEQHGGRIWVESEAGKGSVFSFILPVESDESFHEDPTVTV